MDSAINGDASRADCRSQEPASDSKLIQPVAPQRAAADVAVQVVARLLNLLLGVVATAVLARKLGESGFGMWSTILLIPALLAYLNDLGFLQVAVRRAASEQDLRWLGALVSIRTVLSLPTTLLSLVAIVFVAHGTDMLVAGFIVAAQGLLAGPAALTSVFQLQTRNDLAMVAMTVNSLLWTAAVIFIAAAGGSLMDYAIAMGVIAAATVWMEATIAMRRARIPIRGTAYLWGELVRTAVPLSIGSLLILAYGRIDGVIVYTESGSVAAGLYNSACRVVEQGGFIPLSLVITLMPIVSRLYEARDKKVQRLLQVSLELLAMVSLPALGFTLVASNQVIRLLYGARFLQASGALSVLMGAFFFICCGYALGVFTLVLDLQSRFVGYAFGALCLNVLLNLLLVPPDGFIAAAWVTCVTEAFVSILIGRAVLKQLDMRLRFARFVRIALAAGMSTMVTLGLREAGVDVFGLLAAAGLAQLGGLFLLGALRPSELRAILRREPLSVL
jgi:O-antigen/teichoic acid export membrane protein